MAGKQKTGFTLEQHRAYGEKLLAAREMLNDLYVDVGKAYPLSSVANRRALRGLEAVDRLREELENLASGENPKLDSYAKHDLYRRKQERAGGGGH